MIKLYNNSYLEYLLRCGTFRCAIADPPDNIGLKYVGFKDKFTPSDYEKMLRNIITFSTVKCDVLWLSLNSRHAPLIGHILHEWKTPEWEIKHCVQTFTFSQNNHHDMSNGHRIMYRIMKKDTQLYPDQIRVPSWRQLHGDKRADSRGKVPSDVFEFPRVTGNSKQRRKFSSTQINEGVYERCILLCCTQGDKVVDLFAGSGTLGRVASRYGFDADMVELSKKTCEAIAVDQRIKETL